MVQLSQRLEKIPPYLFAEIDRKIAEAKEKGVDIYQYDSYTMKENKKDKTLKTNGGNNDER